MINDRQISIKLSTVRTMFSTPNSLVPLDAPQVDEGEACEFDDDFMYKFVEMYFRYIYDRVKLEKGTPEVIINCVLSNEEDPNTKKFLLGVRELALKYWLQSGDYKDANEFDSEEMKARFDKRNKTLTATLFFALKNMYLITCGKKELGEFKEMFRYGDKAIVTLQTYNFE